MTTQLELSIDDSVLPSLKEDRRTFARTLKLNAAIGLYRKRRLSLGKAAMLAGYDRLDFIRKLRDEGEPIFDYEEEVQGDEDITAALSSGQPISSVDLRQGLRTRG